MYVKMMPTMILAAAPKTIKASKVDQAIMFIYIVLLIHHGSYHGPDRFY